MSRTGVCEAGASGSADSNRAWDGQVLEETMIVPQSILSFMHN